MEQFTAGGSQLEHCQHLQGASGKIEIGEDGFFHGPLVRLTLMLLRASTFTAFNFDYFNHCMNFMI